MCDLTKVAPTSARNDASPDKVNHRSHGTSTPRTGAKGRHTMPTYISLANLTSQGVKDAKSITSRIEDTRKLFESLGAKLKEVYLVTGQYDYVVIAEAPDDETAAKAVLSLASKGNVRTQTFRAFTAAEMGRIVGDIR